MRNGETAFSAVAKEGRGVPSWWLPEERETLTEGPTESFNQWHVGKWSLEENRIHKSEKAPEFLRVPFIFLDSERC